MYLSLGFRQLAVVRTNWSLIKLPPHPCQVDPFTSTYVRTAWGQKYWKNSWFLIGPTINTDHVRKFPETSLDLSQLISISMPRNSYLLLRKLPRILITLYTNALSTLPSQQQYLHLLSSLIVAETTENTKQIKPTNILRKTCTTAFFLKQTILKLPTSQYRYILRINYHKLIDTTFSLTTRKHWGIPGETYLPTT